MDTQDEIDFLQNKGRIELVLFPADNAARILQSIVDERLEQRVEAGILYAIDVLTTDSNTAALPVGLTFNDSGQLFSTSSIDEDYTIRDWLVLNYTPKQVVRNDRRRIPTTFRVAFK